MESESDDYDDESVSSKKSGIDIQQILYKQTTKMCQLLKMLHSRRKGGHEMANKIWKSLVAAVAEIPPCFDSGDLEFFCKPEEFPVNDHEFRRLIYDGLSERIKSSTGGTQVPNTDSENQDETATLASKIDCFEKDLLCYPPEAPVEEKFFQYMISIIKVVAAKVDNNLQTWETGEEEFDREINSFSDSSFFTLGLVEQLLKNKRLKPEMERLCHAMTNHAKLEPTQRNKCSSKHSYWDVKIPAKAKPKSHVFRQNVVIGMIEHSGISPAEFCDHAGYVKPLYHQRDFKRDKLRCVCGLQYKSLALLEIHMQLNNETQMVTCDFCYFQTSKNCCMEKHISIRHVQMKSNHRLYQCQYGCKTLFLRKKELRLHQSETKRGCKYSNADKRPKKTLSKNFGDLFTKTVAGTGKPTPLFNPTPPREQVIDDSMKILEAISIDDRAYCQNVVTIFFQKKPDPSNQRCSKRAKLDKEEKQEQSSDN